MEIPQLEDNYHHGGEDYDSDSLDFQEPPHLEYQGPPLPIYEMLDVEPVTTAQRLEKYPEMYQLPAFNRNKFAFCNLPNRIVKHEMTGIDIAEEDKCPVAECPECGNLYRTGALSRHMDLHMFKGELPPPGFPCPYENCPVHCDCQLTVNEHVKRHHQRNDLINETLHFPNWQEFERWKEDLEYTTTSRFIKHSGRNNYLGKSFRYTCFFARATPKTSTGRGIRNKPSKKFNKACTAYLLVKQTYNQIQVRGCLTHCGHDELINNLPLSTTVKKEIAALLIRGLEESNIVKIFRETYTPDDRRFYIRPYEIRNVLNKILKTHQELLGRKPENKIPVEKGQPVIQKYRERLIEYQDSFLPHEIPPFVAKEEII